jgi:hypothetical protein
MHPYSEQTVILWVLALALVWSIKTMATSLDRLTAAVAADTQATKDLDFAVTALLADPATPAAPPVEATAAQLDALSGQLETNAVAFKATIAKVAAATAPTIPAPAPTA